MKHGEMREKILETGEAMVRQRGFNGVSFREIADAIGIKSASVHYHFPSKEDFALAVTDRYAERFLAAARDALSGGAPLEARIGAYADLYRAAYDDAAKMCLCGMLAAEAADLPARVRQRVAGFFSDNLDALSSATQDEGRARMILASLQGGMLMARALGGPSPLDAIAKTLRDGGGGA